jgi:hypothetical protein
MADEERVEMMQRGDSEIGLVLILGMVRGRAMDGEPSMDFYPEWRVKRQGSDKSYRIGEGTAVALAMLMRG